MQNSAPIPLTGMGVFGLRPTMSRVNAAAITMIGTEFKRPLNAVLIADNNITTICSTMNSKDPDELVCWSESEEGGEIYIPFGGSRRRGGPVVDELLIH